MARRAPTSDKTNRLIRRVSQVKGMETERVADDARAPKANEAPIKPEAIPTRRNGFLGRSSVAE